jgi:hypothetical protein
MAASCTDFSSDAPVDIPNNSDTCICGCKCYTSSQKEFQALENEVKLTSKSTISTTDEAKYEVLSKVTRKPSNKHDEKSSFEAYTCSYCIELNSKLQSAFQELESVNLINKILQKQIKSQSQTSHRSTEENCEWAIVSSATSNLPKSTYTSMELCETNQYKFQTTNRFAVLQNLEDSQQLNHHLFTSNLVQATKRRPKTIKKYYEGRQDKEPSSSDYCKPSTSSQQDKSNLQSPMKNKDTFSNIPTIINGVVSESSKFILKKEESALINDSITKLINNHQTYK